MCRIKIPRPQESENVRGVSFGKVGGEWHLISTCGGPKAQGRPQPPNRDLYRRQLLSPRVSPSWAGKLNIHTQTV